MNKTVGVIDIGSNSVHLVIARDSDSGYFYILDDVKANVRLCEGFNETGRLSRARMDLGIETLSLFARMCSTYHVDSIVAVATAAVRKAENGMAFVEEVLEKTGISVKIIPGEEEARLDYLGVVNTIDIRDALLMDIGGGSTEFVLIQNRKVQKAVSLPFGSIDLTERFDLNDTIHAKNLKAMDEFFTSVFQENPVFQEAEGLPLIGVGGTIRNIGRIHRRVIDFPLEIAHNYQMQLEEVEKICTMTAEMNLEERRSLKGLSKGRADIFVGASRAVQKVMEAIHAPKLIISDAGLRDGMLFEMFANAEDGLIHNVFDNSLLNMMTSFQVNVPHAYHVYDLTCKLFNQLAPLHQITAETARIQKASAMLHDIGIKIQYAGHHEHSFYLILNGGLYGLDQKELLMSALIAQHHRTNKKIKIDASYMTLLSAEDKKNIDTLSLFLQMAEYLDRSMDGIVKDISCNIHDDKVEMLVLSNKHSIFTDMILSECGKKFRRVFDRELCIENRVISGW